MDGEVALPSEAGHDQRLATLALENARLFDEMRREIALRRDAEQTLRSVVQGTAAVTGSDFFASLVSHLAAALQVPFAFAAACRAPATQARTLAFWCNDRLVDNVSYDIEHTPCRGVLAGEVCHYPERIREFFPKDRDLVELGAESYLGVPVRSRGGVVIGHLAVLDTRPMAPPPRGLSLLEIFAARAGAELERQTAEDELRGALEEVERLRSQLHAENLYLQEEIQGEHDFEKIVGSSSLLAATLAQVERVAPTDSTVLIQGETGTGKELLARAVHGRSARRGRPLVKVNCGAIPAGLVESELFGHVKGAFTGATERRTGRFALADRGTLFLDEVGELPLETQVKLLRVLQEGEFEPVGSSKTQRVDVRLIAATNRSLDVAVHEGRFRADLFYRLNVVPLEVPPLRQRRTDIPELVRSFVQRFAQRSGKRVEGIAPSSLALLMAYDWPGNIRELENVIERGVVLSKGPLLNLDSRLLPFEPGQAAAITARAAPGTSGRDENAEPPVASESDALDDVQRRHILAVLERTHGIIEGKNGAARRLGMHPNTLRSRLKKLEIR
jgi:formate hydrogenlyase transcriptional activator